MGIILSRLSNPGEVSWYYLASLLQVEYRLWMLTCFKRRAKRARSSSRIVSTETVSTQTCSSMAETRIDISLDDGVGEPQPTFSSSPTEVVEMSDLSPSRGFGGRRTVDGVECGELEKSPSPSEYDDILIFENPDFTQFGKEYQHLASPTDKRVGAVAPRARRICSLSPVKEELDFDQCSDTDNPDLRQGHSDTPLVFDELGEVEEGTDETLSSDTWLKRGKENGGRKRMCRVSDIVCCDTRVRYEDDGISETPCGGNSKTPSCDICIECGDEGISKTPCGGNSETPSCDICIGNRTKLACCSFSSDSGIGDGLNRSGNIGTSERPCLSSNSSPESGFGDHTTDPTATQHPDHQKQKCCDRYSNKLFSVELEDPHKECCYNQMYSHMGLERNEVSTVINETGERKRSKDWETAHILPAPPLNTRAKSKVTLLDGSANTLSSSPPCTPPNSPCSSSDFPPSPSFSTSNPASPTRQESTESTTSKSSRDSDDASSDSSDSTCQPLSSLAGKQQYFAEPGEGRDLVLIAEGERFHVHASVLAWHCHVLCTHLKDTRSREVVLLNKRADDLLNFLCLLYPFGEEVTGDNLEGVLDLAHYLGCEQVKKMCSTYLTDLTYFPCLCPHLHSHHHITTVAHHCVAEAVSNSPGDDTNIGSNKRTHLPTIAENESQQPTSLCACAETISARVAEVLQMAVRYELHDVYHVYVDVAARMRTEEWVTSEAYGHLSSGTRENILQSRIYRLENVIDNVRVTKSSLSGCSKSRHEQHHVDFNGSVCLKCMSRRIVLEAKYSV